MVEIGLGELQLPPEVKPAADPYLCNWSEYYFLGWMSHMFLSGQTPPFTEATSQVNGKKISSLLIQKEMMRDIPSQAWERPRNIKLGVPTGLVLQSQEKELADLIVIPEAGDFIVGRFAGRGFSVIDELHESARTLSGSAHEYIDALYDIIQCAKDETGASSYENLYAILKKELLSRRKHI